MIKTAQKLLATLCIVVSSVLSAAAQHDVDINWGKINLTEKRTAYQMIGETPDGSVVVWKTDRKGRMYLEKYDKENLGHEFTEKIDFQLTKNSTSRKDRLEYEDVFVMDDGIVVFGSLYNKKEDYFTIYARAYGLDGSENSGWLKMESVYAEKRRKSGFYDIVLSKDKSKFLIKHTLPEKKSEPRKYGYSVFDSKLQKMYGKTVTFSKASKKDDIYVFGDKISNNGTVYFFARINGAVSVYALDESDEEDANSKDMMAYEVDFSKKSIIEIALFEDAKDNLVLTGFYNDEAVKRNYGISGIVYVKLKKDDFTEKVAKATAFEQEYLENFMSARRARKGKGISTTYDLRHLLFTDNGSATLIAENNYVVRNCSRDPKTGFETCYYTYHFDQLMVIGISPEGEMRYAQYLPKFASSGNYFYGGMSYSVLPVGDDVVIFYNDHYKNHREGARKVRPLPSYKRAVLVKAVITSNGEISKEVLLRHKEAKLAVMPRYYIYTYNKKGVIMIGAYKKTIRLGRFELAAQ